MRRLFCALTVLCLLAMALAAPAEQAVSLDRLMEEIDKGAKALEVGELKFEISPNGQSVFIDRPEIRGADEVTIAYNIYDSDSNPVNYFYSDEERVAATPGYAGLFNVFVVVTDKATQEQVIGNIGWQRLLGPEEQPPVTPEPTATPEPTPEITGPLTVGAAAFEISENCQHVFIDRPAIEGGSGRVTVAYNIYDADSNPVNYFYSDEARVAATPGYKGLFNVFIVVTDLVTGEQNVQNIGWHDLIGPNDPLPTIPPSEGLIFSPIDGTGACRVTGYEGTDTFVVIPAVHDGMPVAEIGQDAFARNADITGVLIPEGVTAVQDHAFSDCFALTDIRLPGTLLSLSEYAFNKAAANAEGTVYVRLPDSLREMARTAFWRSPVILVVTRGGAAEALITDHDYVYADSLDFVYQAPDGERVLMRYTGAETQVRLPDDCARVDRDAFGGRTDLTLICGQLSQTAQALSAAEISFTFPGHEAIRYRIIEGVLNVMGWAGSGEEIVIPEAEEWIAEGRDEQIRRNAFAGHEGVKRAVIPEGVTVIGADAFTDCYLLTDVRFPSTLRAIGSNAFRWCGRDTEEVFYFELPDGVEEITGRGGGVNTFGGVNAVLVTGKTSKTAETLTDGNYVYACPGEKDFRYRYEKYEENGETGRRVWLVGYTGADTRVTIPGGIWGIRRYSANTSDNNWRTFYGNAFYGNAGLISVEIPDGTVVIEDSAFLGCVQLIDVSFPRSLKVLKNHAFERCGSESGAVYYYILPDSMEEIAGIGGAGWESFNGITGYLVASPDSPTARILSDGNYNFALTGHHTDGLLYRYEKWDVNGEKVYRLFVYDYVGSGSEVIIPSGVGVYGISRTPPGGSDPWRPAFYHNEKIEKVVIPDGAAIISDSAFIGCSMLTDVTLPGSIRAIRNHAFEDSGHAAGKRYYIVLPAGLEEMTGNNAAGWASFNNCACVLVAPAGSVGAMELYDNWWVFYTTLDDARNGTNLCYQENDPDFDYYGNP